MHDQDHSIMLNPKILIIEDDPINRKVLSILLNKKLGYNQIEEWSNSANFLTKLKNLSPPPDLIIMDIMIAPIDGFDMIAQMRADSTFDHIKVIAHTASVMREQVNRIQESGFHGLISKPIMRDHFPQLINRILQGEAIWYVS
jgi:CheY-like chemotaxis protein